MKFVLVEAEIKQAIQDYAAKLITLAPGATVDVEVKATRGADGVTAEIDVAMVGAAKPKPQVATEPVAVKAEPVPEQLATAKAPEPTDVEEYIDDEEIPDMPVSGKSIFGS